MSLPVLAGLAALALVDSTSFGTLLLPVWFLLTPGRVRVARLLVFLGTVVAFYFAVGLALLAGADVLLERGTEPLEGTAATTVQLVLGVGLLVGSFFLGPRKGPDGERRPAGRVLRWRERVMTADGGASTYGSVAVLALTATLLELATMLPYLAATGLIAASGATPLEQGGVLAAYCLVMVLPALTLLALRLVAHRLVERPLARIGAWIERTGAETTAWVVGIVGFLLARDAAPRLPWLADMLGGLA
ncbi:MULTISPECIES: GAP family protein [unclassified Actinotalea]|uniref:GAP family protein n=1 Tax=unclassified Actinotalea TaxID=2638618 RepID=UPI0015F57286|nr:MULTISPECIES: GAP family protein [unclassified Actinotalea]